MKYKTVFNNDTGIFNGNMGIVIMKLLYIHYRMRQKGNYINGTWNQGLIDKK